MITKSKDKLLFIKVGDILTFDVIEWYNEGWEFGHPVVMLNPIVTIAHDNDAEALIEDVLIRAVVKGELETFSKADIHEFKWRGWNLAAFKRRFSEVSRGKRFPKARYKATQQQVRIIENKEGELTWESINSQERS